MIVTAVADAPLALSGQTPQRQTLRGSITEGPWAAQQLLTRGQGVLQLVSPAISGGPMLPGQVEAGRARLRDCATQALSLGIHDVKERIRKEAPCRQSHGISKAGHLH